jgi:molybdenum cofactor cytidylyltransferase
MKGRPLERLAGKEKKFGWKESAEASAMISAIVLAAGEGKRMGETKQLLPWKGKPILEHVLDHLRNSRVHEIILVLGHDRERILKEIKTHGIKVLFNPEFPKGMSTSIRKGAAAIDPQARGFFVVLGDQPTIGPEVYDRLIEEFNRRFPQKAIFIPTHQGKRGHPPLFSVRYLPEILSIEGDVGLRAIVQKHPEEIAAVEMGTEAILDDLDTPEQYRKLKNSRDPGENS